MDERIGLAPPAADRPRQRRRIQLDTLLNEAGSAVFSLGLGIAGVAVPLLAIAAGYSATEIGILVALSAIGQITTRLFLGALMRRVPDKVFVALAGAILALSSAVLVLSAAWAVFALSQVLQGVARAFFWTGTQTHAVRVSPSAAGALARINLASGVGQLAGPVLAGLMAERSLQLALAVSASVSVVTVLPGLLLVRLEPFAPLADRQERGRVWRRPGVDTACWAGAAAGAWRGLLSSYVPVVLSQARQSPSTIGVLVAVATGASVAGGALSGRVRGRGLRWSIMLGVLSTGVGIAALGPLAGAVAGAAVALAVSGVGAGVLQTVGPAVASDSVHPDERGEAIASAGTFRAAALFLAPFGVAGMVTVLPLSTALVVAGVLITAPTLGVRRLGRGSPPVP